MENKADSVSMAEFQRKCEDVFRQKKLVDDLEEQRALASLELESMKSKVMALMIDLGMKTIPIAGFGKLTVRKDFRVSMPKEPEAKEAFFGYLKEKGLFEDLATINHNTLNSFYKQEAQAAAEEGNLGFVIPGLGEPKLSEIIVITKG